jgi:hypothetical protein
MSDYTGYLATQTKLIRDLHEGGASTLDIASALYAVGVRAQTSNPYDELNRAEQITNLRGMVIYVLQRLGLRTRRVRILNLKANRTPARRGGRPDSLMMMMMKDTIDEIAIGF